MNDREDRTDAYPARADKISGEDDGLRRHVTNARIQQDLGIIERNLPRDLELLKNKTESKYRSSHFA